MASYEAWVTLIADLEKGRNRGVLSFVKGGNKLGVAQGCVGHWIAVRTRKHRDVVREKTGRR